MHFLPPRSVAVAFALAAMLLRGLLPDGWMPSGQAAPFSICSVTIAHHAGGKPSQPGQEHRHAPCAFAAAAPLAPPAITALAFGISASAVTITTAFTDDRATSSSPHRANAARAPPAFA
jgi:hypothetical protein